MNFMQTLKTKNIIGQNNFYQNYALLQQCFPNHWLSAKTIPTPYRVHLVVSAGTFTRHELENGAWETTNHPAMHEQALKTKWSSPRCQ